MIFDNIKNISKYNFDKDILNILIAHSAITADNFPSNNTVLTNGDFLIHNEYNTQFKETPVFEAHRKYVDVMYMVEGSEIIKVVNIERLKNIISEYDEENDALLAECDENISSICMNSGDFIVLYPQDAHCPACAVNDEPSLVKKNIGKVKISK